MRTILFRFDYGPKIGFGHFSRCSVLAEKFIKRGYRCILLTNKYQINKKYNKIFYKIVYLKKINFFKEENQIIEIYKKFNCKYLIIDKLTFNLKSQKILKKNKIKWLQFIGKISSKCIAHQIICSIPYKAKEINKFDKLNNQKFFIGKNYSILRDQFFKKKKTKTLKKILICFGGGDDRGSIIFILKSIIPNIGDYNINLLIGDNPRSKKIYQWIKNKNLKRKIKILKDKKNVADYIDESQFAICSGGTITHEINSRGKKMIILSLVENQKFQGKKWKNFNNYYLGSFSKNNLLKIRNKLKDYFSILKNSKATKFKKRSNKFLEKIIHNAIKK